MIKSMTGFGRYENLQGDFRFTVEMKAVNHRYFDVNIKIPKKLGFFESAIRSVLKNYIQRGKVDVFITYEDFTENNVSLKYNESLAAEYVKYYKQLAQTFGLNYDVQSSTIGQCPEVFTMEAQTVDEKEIWEVLNTALTGASERFVESRIQEGESLRADLLEKLEHMIGDVEAVEIRYPIIMEAYREKLESKVKDLLEDKQIEESRLAAEIVIYADKICTDEETVRLKSHIESMKASLKEGGSIGRKLDFIAQEMNREANTILSKANDLETSNIAIDLKTEIEKIREQIQNIE